ncbi:TonB-dependent receptor plug domain-containing protein [Steroidobacter sp. S1-65]|uniref:TonB-dependent receptor plug domain-containing protein n=1 Tax=Steroidobacter gossypii TaxID=2805490 RepID=A0ABS1X4V4_9GAMM|nr:TonB-dependent receptor [Steroidobacter gossypii]MBM0108263.1 TonB-dependent receptor plug domain-containing protein [Steroidobacter gossypii]
MLSYRPLVAASLLSLTACALAEEADPLEEILVTARSIEDTLPVELARYGHDVEYVSADRIRAAGYVDASTALQFEVPGLFVSPGSGPFDYVDVSLQGSRPGDVLWLVDGVRISNRIFNETSPDTLPASMIERIEVLKGGESLFYGTQGVAGAINIVTRGFSEQAGGSLAVNYDSNDGYQIGGYARGSIGRHKFVVYSSKNQGDGYRQYDRFQPSTTDRERGYDVTNVGLKYGLDFNDSLRLDLLYHHTDARLDNNQPIKTKRSYNDRDEDIVSVKLAYDASEHVQLVVKAYLHDWDTTYANIQNRPLTGEEVVVYAPGTYWGFHDYGGSALMKVRPGGLLDYHVGYDYQNYKARDDVFPIAGETETVHAVFGEVRTAQHAFDNVSVAAGARYNRGSGGKHATVWNVSGRYTFSRALYLEGVVATAFLLPSAEQLYYIGEDDYAGNPDLEPEQSQNLNLSVGGSIASDEGPIAWQLTGFARDVDNLIDIGAPTEAFPNGRYENLPGVTEVRGLEASLSAPVTGSLRTSFSYTYSESRPERSDLQISRVPVSYAKGSLHFTPSQLPLDASATVNWVGDVYQPLRTLGRRNYGNYVTLNLAARCFVGSAHRHQVGVNLQNVFDEEYATRLVEAQLDDGSGAFLARRLGVPRTYGITYTYEF